MASSRHSFSQDEPKRHFFLIPSISIQGIGFHWEMLMMEQGGLNPYQVLYTATMGKSDLFPVG